MRAFLIAAALGNVLHADVFAIANTIPNMLYILLAGGVFNAVLVPQLVRAAKFDVDGGEAYTNRVVTMAGLFLGGVTVALVLAAPWLMDLFLDPAFDHPALARQRESAIRLAQYCLPQVFFYGMFVLVGQVLNARGRFGPMTWAPIANNLVAIAVLLAYLMAYGPARGAELCGGFSGRQEIVLGIGSTLGVAVQFALLWRCLRPAGIQIRPRFDLRDSGLVQTLRLGFWTVLLVVVNQLAYTVVVRLASGGTAEAASTSCGAGGDGHATGYAVYALAFLIAMVPHSVITVSLVTARLPRMSALAAEGDLAGLKTTVWATLRLTVTLLLPFAALIPVVAHLMANAISFGAARDSFENYAPTLALFGPGILLFSVQYVLLRGFYALQRTRTVFLLQSGTAILNVTGAVLLVAHTDSRNTAPALALAYGCAYLLGSALSGLALIRALGGGAVGSACAYMGRLATAVGASTGAALLAAEVLDKLGGELSQGSAALAVCAIAALDALVFVLAARALRLTDVSSLPGIRTGRPPAGN